MPKSLILILSFLILNSLLCFAQDTLEEIVTWEVEEGYLFRCENFNSKGSDINNDGYDDYINELFINDASYFYFYLGSETPETIYSFEIEAPYSSGAISWGGDLNNDGYKDIVYNVQTQWSDPGDIYICLGGEEIDLEPELILLGEDYVADGFGLFYTGFNGGYDFNGDGYDDLLAWGQGPSYFFNGLVQIFLGGEELSNQPAFQIQGADLDQFGNQRAVGDFNGDGYDDLVASRLLDGANESEMQFELYLGGETLNTIPDYITEIYPAQLPMYEMLAGGDVNNDGYDDFLLIGIGLFLGNPEGNLELSFQIIGNLCISDINGDSFDDIVSKWLPTIDVYYGSEDFDIIPDITMDTSNSYLCNIGDFDNDGQDEILLNDSGTTTPGNSATVYGLPGSDAGNDELQITNYELRIKQLSESF